MNEEMSLKERLESIKAQNDPNVNTIDDSVQETMDLLNMDDEDEMPVQDYKSLIKNDIDQMDDSDFAETRKEAFNAVKNDFKSRLNADETETPTRTKSKAELYEEKNPIIKADPNNKPKEEVADDIGSQLIDSVKDIEKDTEEKSKLLYELQNNYESEQENIHISQPEDTNSDDIDDILSAIDEHNAKKDMDISEEDEDNLSALIEKLESQKLYSDYKREDEYVGPADYVVDKNPDYEEAVEDILTGNGFNIIKKSNKEKSALLERFVNSGSEVTVPLVNSGIYVKFSGASTTEIISMNQITGDTDAEMTLNKLNIMNSHITGSSIGKMRLAQLIKVVSYYDIETLNFAFYAATHPDMTEITRNCNRCGQEYFIKQHTRDLLINPEDYADEATEIRNNVTTYEILQTRSQLNKIIKKVCSNGDLIVYFKHPSIESYIKTARNLTSETMRKYPQLVDMAYAIDKVFLRDSGTNYAEFSDPNSIIDIIGKIKNPRTKYELLDILEEIRPCAIPSYGYSNTICPHCGNKDKEEAFSMENLLFTVAQQEDEMETLRWAAKLQERRKSKKK